MDFGSAVIDVDKPCCSKSLTKVPRDYQKNRSNEVIVIDEDDSCDSAYETGSSLSRSSCLSSPICKYKNICYINTSLSRVMCVE